MSRKIFNVDSIIMHFLLLCALILTAYSLFISISSHDIRYFMIGLALLAFTLMMYRLYTFLDEVKWVHFHPTEKMPFIEPDPEDGIW